MDSSSHTLCEENCFFFAERGLYRTDPELFQCYPLTGPLSFSPGVSCKSVVSIVVSYVLVFSRLNSNDCAKFALFVAVRRLRFSSVLQRCDSPCAAPSTPFREFIRTFVSPQLLPTYSPVLQRIRAWLPVHRGAVLAPVPAREYPHLLQARSGIGFVCAMYAAYCHCTVSVARLDARHVLNSPHPQTAYGIPKYNSL